MTNFEKLFESHDFKVTEYLTKLAAYPTQADPKGLPPFTLKRFKECANYIAKTLSAIGIKNVEVTGEAYVYATIPSNLKRVLPAIALMAHYDTALENSGDGTKMLIHSNYQGGDIVLANNVTINALDLKSKIGHDVLTGAGDNQLGADDKCGVAAILDVARFLMKNSEIPHGEVRLIFNNNEEVGRGTEFLDYKKAKAAYAYCVDGGEIGDLFEENFNAEAVDIEIEGKTIHPGYAYKKMVNALLVANDLTTMVYKRLKSPEMSKKREPYIGLNSVQGNWTRATVHFLLRGFDEQDIINMKKELSVAKKYLITKYKGVIIREKWDEIHRYKNAKEILTRYPKLNTVARKAYKSVGVKPKKDLVRGGFDGVRMSFDGLPTTNIFSAAMNMHGLDEWTTRQDLELTVKMLANLCYLWGKEK